MIRVETTLLVSYSPTITPAQACINGPRRTAPPFPVPHPRRRGCNIRLQKALHVVNARIAVVFCSLSPVIAGISRIRIASPSPIYVFSRGVSFDTLSVPWPSGVWRRSIGASPVDLWSIRADKALFVIICTIIHSTVGAYPQPRLHLLSPGVSGGVFSQDLNDAASALLLVRRGRFFYALDRRCPVYGEPLLFGRQERDKNHEQ